MVFFYFSGYFVITNMFHEFTIVNNGITLKIEL